MKWPAMEYSDDGETWRPADTRVYDEGLAGILSHADWERAVVRMMIILDGGVVTPSHGQRARLARN